MRQRQCSSFVHTDAGWPLMVAVSGPLVPLIFLFQDARGLV